MEPQPDYSTEKICELLEGKLFLQVPAAVCIDDLLTDSRKIIHPETSLFFALKGDRHDGHKFIPSLVDGGVANFVISHWEESYASLNANFILVGDTHDALQKLAAIHRSRFHFPVLGITGSNGKTIVKEWLFQLLRPDKNIVRSPKSYNSQIGVPLSVWLLDNDHELALIEAGI